MFVTESSYHEGQNMSRGYIVVVLRQISGLFTGISCVNVNENFAARYANHRTICSKVEIED